MCETKKTPKKLREKNKRDVKNHMYEATPVRVFIDTDTTNRNKPHSQLNNHNFKCMPPANLLYIYYGMY